MEAALFTLLVFLLTAALFGLIWWRFKGGGRVGVAATVATSNHKSLPSFHYGSAPPALRTAPTAAAPALAETSPLAMLLPEDEFFRRQEQEIQAEADRAEAEEIERRAQAELPAAAGGAEKAVTELAPSLAPSPVAACQQGASATVSVLDILSPDERPTSSREAAETAAGPAEPAEDTGDDTVAESIYDNPLTAPISTRNDEANRLAAVALRQRKRAAIMAKSGDQKTALVALLVSK